MSRRPMDKEIKIKKVDISNNDWPKIARLGDYWLDKQATEFINLLK